MKYNVRFRRQLNIYRGSTEKDLSQILLVRSVEECEPDFFLPEDVLDAIKLSEEADDDASIIQKRANFLFQKLPEKIRNIPQLLILPKKWIAILCIASLFLGIIFNYLGPGEKIHVIYNPAVLLILWNIIVFLIFIYRLISKRGHKSGKDLYPSLWFSGSRSLKGIALWSLKKKWIPHDHHISKKKTEETRPLSFTNIMHHYVEHWWNMNHHVIMARLARAIHLVAITMVIGALAGIYIRGLFFEYNVVWKSTFIKDVSDMRFILNIFFGLPSLLLNGVLIEESGIKLLAGPDGAPAASWIHLFAVSALIYVFPPRFFLIFLESNAIRAYQGQTGIDLTDDYYANRIKIAKEIHLKRLQEKISTVVRIEISKLSESIAVYARDRFYDKEIVPQLNDFRMNGGRITDLEDAITKESVKFSNELKAYLETAQADFRRSLAEALNRAVGKELSTIELTVEHGVHVAPQGQENTLGEPITQNMTNAISLAVTAAIAATLGTLSGGFGKVLGIAVVTTLMGTTGPIGFIIGALAGLLVGGGATLIAKDKITDAVKDQNIPSFVTQMILRDSKMNDTIEQGRKQVYNSVKKQIENKLSPQVDAITNQVLSKIALEIIKRS